MKRRGKRRPSDPADNGRESVGETAEDRRLTGEIVNVVPTTSRIRRRRRGLAQRDVDLLGMEARKKFDDAFQRNRMERDVTSDSDKDLSAFFLEYA